MKLIHGDCLEKLKDLSDNSIDICIADMPFQIFAHLKWDCLIDIDKLWVELKRVCKDTCPIFLFGDFKFCMKLINSNPKWFKYEIVWSKGVTTTPLLSRKRLGKSTEYICIFYKKQCVYNYAKYHKIKEKKCQNRLIKKNDPKLPVNVVKEPLKPNEVWKGSITNGGNTIKCIRNEYEPKLPVNVVKGLHTEEWRKAAKKDFWGSIYEPTLPVNIIECKSKRRNKIIKNITEKPQFILEFLLKYFSNEEDTVLDFCMGSGSCGEACKKLNRNFIGIELNKDHYDKCCERLL